MSLLVIFSPLPAAHHIFMFSLCHNYTIIPQYSLVFTWHLQIIKSIVMKEMALIPRFNLGICDVRDVAEAHFRCMTLPEAAGESPGWRLHHHYHQPLHPVVSWAATKNLLSVLSQPRQWTPRVLHGFQFISLSSVLLHVVLGLPLFLFPPGVQWSDVLVITCGSFFG